jgi:hypothetical protein
MCVQLSQRKRIFIFDNGRMSFGFHFQTGLPRLEAAGTIKANREM